MLKAKPRGVLLSLRALARRANFFVRAGHAHFANARGHAARCSLCLVDSLGVLRRRRRSSDALWSCLVKSGIALRDTWSKRQAGVMRPVRRSGWVCAMVLRTLDSRWGYLVYHEGPGLADPAGPLRSDLAFKSDVARSAFIARVTQLFAAGAPLAAHTQPALRTGLMAPARHLFGTCLAPAPCYLGGNS